MVLTGSLGPHDAASWDDATQGGRHLREFFNRYGDLRHIKRLRFWTLGKVLMEKYDLCEQDANEMADFLAPILDFVPEKRPTAAQCLSHPWITGGHRLLAPSSSNSLSEATENHGSKNNLDKDEREAMEVRVGNIAIDGASVPVKASQSSNLAKKT